MIFCTTCIARENNLSQRADVAGVAKYCCAMEASLLCEPACLDHHSHGQASVLMVGSTLYRHTLFSTQSTSYSESDSDEAASRANFLFGGSDASTDFSAATPCSLSKLVTEAHTSPS